MENSNQLVHELRNAAYHELQSYGHPEMPKSFHAGVSNVVTELARAVHFHILAKTDAFAEARRFVLSEYNRIYAHED